MKNNQLEDTIIYTEKFDAELKKRPHYQMYPEMLPLIGSNINEVDKHFLFIGESHYLPKKKEIHTDHELWYKERFKLNETEQYWLSTRKIINKGRNRKYESRAHSIYINIEKALLESGMNPELQDNMFRYCSFMNFFQRPACPNVSIKDSHIDRQTAFETLCHVALATEVDALIFVSRQAYEVYNWYVENTDQALSIPYHVVPHPTSSWWNRKSSKYTDLDNNQHTGKEHLQYILSKARLSNMESKKLSSFKGVKHTPDVMMLNDVINNDSKITLISGRPGMGATFLLTWLINSWSKNNKTILYIDVDNTNGLSSLKKHIVSDNPTVDDNPINFESILSKKSIYYISEVYNIDDIYTHVLSLSAEMEIDLIVIDSLFSIKSNYKCKGKSKGIHKIMKKLSKLQEITNAPLVLGSTTKRFSDNGTSTEEEKSYLTIPRFKDFKRWNIIAPFCQSLISIHRPDYFGLESLNMEFPHELYFYSPSGKLVGESQVHFDFDRFIFHKRSKSVRLEKHLKK